MLWKMSKIKLVCFDLDDTLITEIHSVMFLSKIHGKLLELQKIEEAEEKGDINWIEADYQKAELVEGLHIDEIKINFNNVIKPIKKIRKTIETLHNNGIKTILITAGPIQVAKTASETWGIEEFYGSDYEVKNGYFTGRITEHLGDKGKLRYLKECCQSNNVKPEECIAIGDGASDIPLFEFCGTSIALNYTDSVIGKATYYVKTDDLSKILEYII